MTQAPMHFVIVGGGTAGWMSAAYLERRFSSPQGQPVRITLIESDEILPIGVGEATIPSIVTMMRDLGVPEYRLFAEVDATFKNAIKFVSWHRGDGRASEGEFYHQFDVPPSAHGHSAIVHWMALRAAGIDVAPLSDATSIGSALCENNRAPKLFHSPPYEAPIPYAYHVDAAKLGQLLRSIAESRGVQRIAGHVQSADRDEDGNIVAVQLADGRDVEGDFFLDCTGFRGLLIEGVLGAKWDSFSDRLICDTAVTCQRPHAESSRILRPYTTCTAKDAGWVWEIDLQSRTGAGYVYSSRFTSDEQARERLIDHLGLDGDSHQTRKIEMRIGRRPETWVKNCLAVGLSGGFLEPLESTGIHLIELALRVFVDHVAMGTCEDIMRRHYNRLMRDAFDEVADFLIMHYNLNRRSGDAFWDFCREQLPMPSSLVEKLQLWSVKAPSISDLRSSINVFSGFSYSTILAGLGAIDGVAGNLSPFMDLKKSADVLDQIRHDRSIAVQASPPHEEIIQKLRGTAG